MNRRRVAACLVLLGLVDRLAEAQPCGTAPLVTTDITQPGWASTALSDTQYRNPADPESIALARTYIVKGNCLHAFYNFNNGKNAAGDPVEGFNVNCWNQPVASGVYYYQLKSGGSVETRSMVVLK